MQNGKLWARHFANGSADRTIPVWGLLGSARGDSEIAPAERPGMEIFMEILRYKSDAWGQRILEGASWDLIWVFAAAAVIFIVFHAIYTHRKLTRRQNDE